MKKFTLLLSVPLFCLAFFSFALLRTHRSAPSGPRVVIGTASFSVEIADTEARQEKGLGARDALCETCGMLFVFDRSDTYGFWMKGMRFPLDILWIRDGKVIHIERSIDFHDQQRVYQPDQPVNRVLEVNAGTCEKENIQEGESIAFEEK